MAQTFYINTATKEYSKNGTDWFSASNPKTTRNDSVVIFNKQENAVGNDTYSNMVMQINITTDTLVIDGITRAPGYYTTTILLVSFLQSVFTKAGSSASTTAPIFTNVDQAVNYFLNTRPDYQPVFEDKVRKPNANYQYNGTVRNVGVGQTYTTITAAFAACSIGDIVQIIDGTYLTSAEAGGWLSLNAVNKSVLIRGNATNPGAVIIQQNASATYCVRLRNLQGVTFQNITFTSNQSNETVSYDLNTVTTQNVVFDNCIITNTSSSAVKTITMSGNYGGIANIELKDCTVSSNTNIASGTIGYSVTLTDAIQSNAATKQTILITGGYQYGWNYYGDQAVNVAMYDVQCIQNQQTTNYVWGVGADVAQPANFGSVIDVRGCSFKYTNNYFGHAVILGRGTGNVYFVNNTLYVPSVASSLALGLVMKSIATNPVGFSTADAVIIEGNKITAPLPVLFKGSKNNRFRYNTAISIYPDLSIGYGFRIDNPNNADGPISSTGNVIQYNTFTGKIAAIYLTTASGATSAKTSALACTINNNRYKVSAGTTYVNNDGTLITWAGRSAFWSQDANSTFVTP